ncbi:hypothetical protein BVRB_3g049030 [Beta vulgaris subsp. vulgaris]|uniref:transcription factor MYB4 n=1 Tax=Beta vulgaris subsp. vulgaris TaxID=3555 RepID=UPI00053F93CA|nr:transcription factor MYB4 [Beta vulgaris subsp. vulgaris]KMT16617.1 hypothetical protein BVRB_3g049030 [Beta vulgaris subsp. vulgaris]
MGRAPCCDKVGLKKGPWTPEEDQILISFIQQHGHSNWRALPKQSGLLRCGKSCRLRWINYLRPDIKRGNFSKEEEDTIIQLHEMMGNRWSAIAARLPGRTDNEIKNVWHTHLKKRLNQYQTTKSQGKIGRKSREINNVTTTTTTTTDSFSGTNDQVDSSPQQSSTTSCNDFSSGSEVSSVKFDNDTSIINVHTYDNSIQQSDLEYLPIIDETFWESHDNSSWDGDYNINSDFSNVIEEDNDQIQFDSFLVKENSQVRYSTNNGLDDSNMDFWLDVFVQAGGAPELPEF